MPYREPEITDENGDDMVMPGAEYLPNMQMYPYRSNENAFIKHLTERHIPEEMGSEHKNKWFHRTMYSGKERSTAFFEDPRSLMFINASRKNLNLMEVLDQDELIWSQTYDMIDTAVTTHGQHGNLMKALTIKRQEFQDKTERMADKTILQKLFGKKEEENQPMMVRY